MPLSVLASLSAIFPVCPRRTTVLAIGGGLLRCRRNLNSSYGVTEAPRSSDTGGVPAATATTSPVAHPWCPGADRGAGSVELQGCAVNRTQDAMADMRCSVFPEDLVVAQCAWERTYRSQGPAATYGGRGDPAGSGPPTGRAGAAATRPAAGWRRPGGAAGAGTARVRRHRGLEIDVLEIRAILRRFSGSRRGAAGPASREGRASRRRSGPYALYWPALRLPPSPGTVPRRASTRRSSQLSSKDAQGTASPAQPPVPG